MPRKRLVPRERRVGLTLAELATLTHSELFQLCVDSPGMTTVGSGEPWRASPSYGVEANRLITERGAWS